jgi:hypothetical protein
MKGDWKRDQPLSTETQNRTDSDTELDETKIPGARGNSSSQAGPGALTTEEQTNPPGRTDLRPTEPRNGRRRKQVEDLRRRRSALSRLV